MPVYTTVRIVYGDYWDATNQGEDFVQVEALFPDLAITAAVRQWDDERRRGRITDSGWLAPVVSASIHWQGTSKVPESSWVRTLPGWRWHLGRLPTLAERRRQTNRPPAARKTRKRQRG